MENLYLEHTKMKVKTLKLAMSKALEWHTENQKIVFTNGCFDLLHRGHIEYLSQAAALGDRLIIGLNSDTSVRRLKGDKRPIHTQEDRAILLASMYWVDAVVIFEQDTPLKLIRALMPDVLVKGGDYQIKDIVGAEDVLERGGEVLSLSFIDGYSSSKVIDKITGKNDKN